jgi:uncharacterized protein
MNSPVKIWRNQKTITSLLGLTGVVVTITTIRVPPEGFIHQAPYQVALVKLDTGKTIPAQVVDSIHPVAIGDTVVTVIRRSKEAGTDGVIPYGIKVKPV